MSSSDEEFVPEDESEVGPALVKKLRDKLKKALEEKQEYLDGWQRSRADFVNFKRAEETLHAEKEERIKAELIEELLPALDTLELSLKHSDSKDLELIQKQFLDLLKKAGVDKFGEVGETYDPHKHEALAQQTEGQKIVSVERSGYSIGNKVIRPAQVII